MVKEEETSMKGELGRMGEPVNKDRERTGSKQQISTAFLYGTGTVISTVILYFCSHFSR